MLGGSNQERTPLLGDEGENVFCSSPPGKNRRGDIQQQQQHYHYIEDQPFNCLNTFCVFLFPALGGFLFGYDIGGTSAVLAQLKNSTLSGVSWSDVIVDSAVLQGIITSSGVLGAMFGSIICFYIGETIGRRVELIIAGSLYFSGSLVEAASGASSWGATQGIFILLLGRLTYGLGCGFAMHGAPAYIGEMAPSAVRGIMVSMKEAMIVVGIVLGYLLGWVFEESEGRWRSIYGVAAVPASVMVLGMLRMPPSARWLVLKGRIERARKALEFVTPNVSEAALAEIQTAADKAHVSMAVDDGEEDCRKGRRRVKTAVWGLGMFEGLNSPTCKPALIVGVGLVVLQQITGQPSVLYYADSLFHDVGMDNSASVLVGLFKLVATLVAVFTVDGQGRRKLLKLGCALMLFALLILAVCFLFPYTGADDCDGVESEDACTNGCAWTADCVCEVSSTDCSCCSLKGGLDLQRGFILAAMFVYIGGYQVGFGPVSWLLISEVFPLDVRGKAISVAVVMNFFSNLVITFLFPTLLELLGTSSTFFIFALIDIYALYFIQTRVPETKGLTLEEIEQMFLKMSRGPSYNT